MISRRPESTGRMARLLVCVRGTVSKLRVDVHYAVLKIPGIIMSVRVAIILDSQSSVYSVLLIRCTQKIPSVLVPGYQVNRSSLLNPHCIGNLNWESAHRIERYLEY